MVVSPFRPKLLTAALTTNGMYGTVVINSPHFSHLKALSLSVVHSCSYLHVITLSTTFASKPQLDWTPSQTALDKCLRQGSKKATVFVTFTLVLASVFTHLCDLLVLHHVSMKSLDVVQIVHGNII